MRPRILLLATILYAALCSAQNPKSGKPIPIKIVVVSMFERGADTGDQPGELQLWVERDHLDRILPFPQGYHDLRMNRDGVLSLLTGVGTAKAAANVMALGLDPRFDLTHAYWLVAGIAGVDPADASLGSAAWAEWVVDGDIGYEIDAREIPKDWPTGKVPLRKSVPYEQPVMNPNNGEAYRLNPALTEWAYQLTKGVALTDSEEMQKDRAPYASANARKPPFVLKGDTLSSSNFWHGQKMDEWANAWVNYFTEGRGNYVTTAMEDTGTLQSLTFLAKAGRVDLNRVMVLRTASDYDAPSPGTMTAAQSLARNKGGGFSGFGPAIEAAWRVGDTVVQEIVKNWPKYRDHAPSAVAAAGK
jgi:purine nucleoside permease